MITVDKHMSGEGMSKKGYLNGFVSNSNRFQISADQQTSDPTI